MKVPFTHKMLEDWSGSRTFRDAKILFDNNRIETVKYEHPYVYGVLNIGPRGMKTKFELLPDGLVENHCPCRANRDQGMICTHIIALGMELIRRHTDPRAAEKSEKEMRRAQRLAQINESAYLKRVPEGTIGAKPARLKLSLSRNWTTGHFSGHIMIKASVVINGKALDPETIPTKMPLVFSKQDENLLFVLEDICEGPLKGSFGVSAADFINFLQVHIGKPLPMSGSSEPATVRSVKMNSMLQLDMDAECGELLLSVYTELPFQKAGELPVYIIGSSSGWIYHAGNFWPLRKILPLPLHSIYKEAVRVPRVAVPNFFKTELPMLQQHIHVVQAITEDLITMEPETPVFKMVVKGSEGAVTVKLHAVYDDIDLIAGKPDPNSNFAHEDAEDLMRYTVRNPDAEARALQRLHLLGFQGNYGDNLSSVEGPRNVLNFLGSSLPKLRRIGWKIEMSGPVEQVMDTCDFVTPVVHIDQSSDGSWFDIGFTYENLSGASLSPAEIQRALQRGESWINRDGKTFLLDADALNTARDVFSDCACGEGAQAGTFRLEGVYSAYVQASLDSLDGIDVEADHSWREKARRQNRSAKIEPVALPYDLDRTLRHYQKDGVNWLRFLEQSGCGGILADEMGLGKTLQTLTWLSLKRADEKAHGKPALIVCPTSLVFNWAEEVSKWTPDMKVLPLSGAKRHSDFDKIDDAEIVITSYALIRRDADQYLEREFCAVVLDEAQHIKNRSTQNAQAVKKIKALNRLVLTGTPVENSVADLWSIMDFLMPGYLGPYKHFRENYELPISRGGPDAELAQMKLRRKLHPFLMRRLKKDVAKDLPPKIVSVTHCELTRDQEMVYKEILNASKRRIQNMVAEKGFNRCRMEIFKTLLQLRQTCCHLDLLKLGNVNAEYPSAKLDLFMEMLDEGIDAGHRILVFSQFTSMLALLRKALEEKDVPYCYLDGSTKDRMGQVREFNTNKSIPVFLISLKAGGTGLNLTGADMVIHFDPWWNPAVEDQATDRAYRIGQKRTVYSVKLITKGTIEEKVLAMQKKKQAVIDATLVKDEQVMEKLTWEDVQELLEF
ncbi:SNF2-related protein [Verrucomicrobiota bacterium]